MEEEEKKWENNIGGRCYLIHQHYISRRHYIQVRFRGRVLVD